MLNGIELDFAKLGDVPDKELWISGKMDDIARKIWESKGWKIFQDVNQKISKSRKNGFYSIYCHLITIGS